MTMDEIELVFDGMNPVKLSDGKFGLMIRCGSSLLGDNTVGVQVAGEEDIRWIPCVKLKHRYGCFTEVS